MVDKYLIQYQILRTHIMGIVSQTVRRIRYEILGVKALTTWVLIFIFFFCLSYSVWTWKGEDRKSEWVTFIVYYLGSDFAGE